MQNRPVREELLCSSNKHVVIVDEHLPKFLKAGDLLFPRKNIKSKHLCAHLFYTKEIKKELYALMKNPESRQKLFITANSGIIGISDDIELKEE